MGMSFGNALNEAARDADVYRMFSPAGNGYMATKKCENAYLTGLAVTFIGVLAVVHAYMGWELLIFSIIVGSAAGKIWMDTVPALFSSASIVEYWKKGRGGEDDPYDLRIPVQGFNQQLSGIDLAKGITPFRRAQTPRDEARTLSV